MMRRRDMTRHGATPVLEVGRASAAAGICEVSGAPDGQAVGGPPMKTTGSCPETIDLQARAVDMTVGMC